MEQTHPHKTSEETITYIAIAVVLVAVVAGAVFLLTGSFN